MRMSDFEFNDEEKFATHKPSGLMLDYEFTVIFDDKTVTDLFKSITKQNLSEKMLENLREKMRENLE